MQVAYIGCPITALGPGKRLGLWLSGCDGSCRNCISPELKDFTFGTTMSVELLAAIIGVHINFEGLTGLTISGGEPVLQHEELFELLRLVGVSDVLLYSGKSLEYLQHQAYWNEIQELVAVLVSDEYVEELNDGRALRGSSNQRITYLKPEYKEAYSEYQKQKRTVQSIRSADTQHIIGIPPKN